MISSIARSIGPTLQALIGALMVSGVTPASAAPDAGLPPRDSVYAGFGLGMSQVNPSENGSGWYTVDKSSTGFSLYLGYPINAKWFAELTYADLGDAGVAARNSAISGMEKVSYQVPSLTAGYYFWQPDDALDAYVRAGIGAIMNKNTGDIELYEQNTSAQFVLGLGGQWRFAEDLFARLEFTSYDADANFISLSVGYWFND